METFSETQLPVVDKAVLRLGVAGNYGIDSDDVRWASDRGVRYWLWGASFGRTTEGLRAILKADRDAHVVALLGAGLFGWQVRWSVEAALRALRIDYLDVFKLGWLGVTSRLSRGILDALLQLKNEGKIRAIGTSIHDRARAGRLAADSDIDLLMIRYNAKHPGAEQDIFPYLSARNPAVVAYTALAWRQLTRPLKGLERPPLTPDDCYRFVLGNPHIHVVLSGPADRRQLEENLRSLARGPLEPEAYAAVRAYGAEVKKLRKLDYV